MRAYVYIFLQISTELQTFCKCFLVLSSVVKLANGESLSRGPTFFLHGVNDPRHSAKSCRVRKCGGLGNAKHHGSGRPDDLSRIHLGAHRKAVAQLLRMCGPPCSDVAHFPRRCRPPTTGVYIIGVRLCFSGRVSRTSLGIVVGYFPESSGSPPGSIIC